MRAQTSISVLNSSTNQSALCYRSLSSTPIKNKRAQTIAKIPKIFEKKNFRRTAQSLDIDEKEDVSKLNFFSLDSTEKSSLVDPAFQDCSLDRVKELSQIRRNKNFSLDSFKKFTSMGNQFEINQLRLARKQENQIIKEKYSQDKNYEVNLIKNQEILEEKMKNISNDMNLIRKDRLKLREKMTEINQDLRNMKLNSKQLEKNYKIKLNQKQVHIAQFMVWRQEHREKLNKKEVETYKKIDIINQELGSQEILLNDMEIEINNLKRQIIVIKNDKIKHYMKILADGEDTRNDGLAWVVKELWDLDQVMTPENFPKFLDQISIEIIVELAQKYSDIEKLQDHISLTSLSHSNSKSNITRRWNNIKSRLSNATKNIIAQKPVYTYNKALKSKELCWVPISPRIQVENEESYEINEILLYETQISKLKSEIIDIKNREMKRLATECSSNHYELFHNITLRDLLSTICGFSNVDKCLPSLIKQQKLFLARINSTKTFSFTSKLALSFI